jgi:S1-C subfamily serine protease
VLVFDAKDKSAGTGFVVASDATESKILTAAHVVAKATAVQIFINNDLSVAYRAQVLKTDANNDLALLRVSKPNLPALTIGSSTTEGKAVALAGYPVASYDFLQATNELKPSVHDGIVGAVRLDGMIIEDSAVADHGDSGGPLFESDSGYVVGVVRGELKNANGAYIATGYKAISDFLSANGISTGAETENSAVLSNAPGAYRLILTHGGVNDNEEQASTRAMIESHIFPKIDSLLPGAITVQDESVAISETELRSACSQNNTIGVLAVGEGWSWTPQANAYVLPKVSADLDVGILDCFGDVLWVARKSKTVNSGGLNSESAIVSSMDDLADQVVTAIKSQFSAGQTEVTNFLRFGYPMGDAAKLSYFALTTATSGASVSWIAPYGTAARAGLQKGQIVTSVNGQSTIGMTQADLTRILTTQQDEWTLEVQNPDGTSATLTFPSRDMRWYLSHPLP